MAAIILNMPGVNCEFYAQGRCMFDEYSNPGLDPELRCKVLKGWMEEFDSFVNQADRFGLDEVTAASIWERKLDDLVRRGPECRQFHYTAFCDWPGSCDWPRSEEQGEEASCDCSDGHEKNSHSDCQTGCGCGNGQDQDSGTAQVHFACAYARQDVCLLRLPKCMGVCARFQTARLKPAKNSRNHTSER